MSTVAVKNTHIG